MEHVKSPSRSSSGSLPGWGRISLGRVLDVFQVQVVVLCCILDGGQYFLVEGHWRNLIGGYLGGENLPAEPFRLVT
jgi:hypothetical protein